MLGPEYQKLEEHEREFHAKRLRRRSRMNADSAPKEKNKQAQEAEDETQVQEQEVQNFSTLPYAPPQAQEAGAPEEAGVPEEEEASQAWPYNPKTGKFEAPELARRSAAEACMQSQAAAAEVNSLLTNASSDDADDAVHDLTDSLPDTGNDDVVDLTRDDADDAVIDLTDSLPDTGNDDVECECQFDEYNTRIQTCSACWHNCNA